MADSLEVRKRKSLGGQRSAAKKWGKPMPPPLPPAAPKPPRETVAEQVARLAKAPKPPAVVPGSTLAEQMTAQVEWLQRRIAWGQDEGGETASDLTKWTGQLTNAQRHLAKLTGALEVSEGQILKSPKFARLLQIIVEAVGDDSAAVARIHAALKAYGDGTSG